MKQLLDDGAHVAFCARSPSAIEDALTALPAGKAERAHGVIADVTDTVAMQRFADDAEARLRGIDSLVCNAGIWGPKGPLDRIPWADWLYAFDVNVHGVARTLRAFLPAIRRAGNGRIAILSGGGATKPMPNIAAYSATKTAVVRLGETIAEELRDEGIPVNMIAPGAVNTRMLDELLEAGPETIGKRQYSDALKQRDAGGTPPERGAALCSFLLSERCTGITGKLISAIWDPWESLGAHRDDLAGDIYTLRRITPDERGHHW